MNLYWVTVHYPLYTRYAFRSRYAADEFFYFCVRHFHDEVSYCYGNAEGFFF